MIFQNQKKKEEKTNPICTYFVTISSIHYVCHRKWMSRSKIWIQSTEFNFVAVAVAATAAIAKTTMCKWIFEIVNGTHFRHFFFFIFVQGLMWMHGNFNSFVVFVQWASSHWDKRIPSDRSSSSQLYCFTFFIHSRNLQLNNSTIARCDIMIFGWMTRILAELKLQASVK